jgi:hypothetical protein
MTMAYRIADIGLAVGAVELVTSAVLFFTRPEQARPASAPGVRGAPPRHASRAAYGTWAFAPSATGASVAWRLSF